MVHTAALTSGLRLRVFKIKVSGLGGKLRFYCSGFGERRCGFMIYETVKFMGFCKRSCMKVSNTAMDPCCGNKITNVNV